MYLLIMTVLFLLAFAGVLVLLYLRKQDGLELEATDAVLTMATASLTRSVDYNEQLFAQLISAEADFANRSRGYEMDLEGMGRQQRTLGGLLARCSTSTRTRTDTVFTSVQDIGLAVILATVIGVILYVELRFLVDWRKRERRALLLQEMDQAIELTRRPSGDW
jgi:hypothetical protein